MLFPEPKKFFVFEVRHALQQNRSVNNNKKWIIILLVLPKP
jgi:hypothetical protein